jgi:hypothetical protein
MYSLAVTLEHSHLVIALFVAGTVLMVATQGARSGGRMFVLACLTLIAFGGAVLAALAT